MRSLQYVFILIGQIILLGAIFTFGANVVDLSRDRGHVTDTFGVEQPPAGNEQGDLREFLTR